MTEKQTLITLGLIMAVILFFLGFAYDKGVDLTDEGLYLALSNPFQDNHYSQLNYNVLFQIIHDLTGISFDLKGLRILKFLLLFLVFFLSFPVFNYFKISGISRLFLAIGLTSNYAYFGQSLSYNTLAFFFFVCFLLIGFRHFFEKNSIYHFLLLGVFGSFSFMAKSTVGLMLIPTGLLLILCDFLETKNLKALGKHIILFLMGYFVLQILFGLVDQTYNFLDVIANGFELSGYTSTHNRGAILKYPISAFRWILILFAAGFCFRKSLQIVSKRTRFVNFLFSLCFLGYFFISHSDLNIYKIFEYFPLIMCYFFVGYFTAELKTELISGKEKIFLLILLVSSLIVSFGTISYHFKGGILYLFFPFLLIAILIQKISYVRKINYNFLIIVLSFYLSIRVFLNIIYLPFKQPSLLGQMTSYRYNEGSEIKLPIVYVEYLKNLKESFNKHVPVDKGVIGFYEMPGDVILAGRYNGINPCLWEKYQWDFYKSKYLFSNNYINENYILINTISEVDKLGFGNFVVLDSLFHYSGKKVFLLRTTD